MDEVQLYNLYSHINGAGDKREQSSKNFALLLMISHLHYEHKKSIRSIAKILNLKMKEVKALLNYDSSN